MYRLKTYLILMCLSGLQGIQDQPIGPKSSTPSDNVDDRKAKMMKYNINGSPIDYLEMGFPAFFDARLKWGQLCETLNMIVNQGRCKSGWAITIASVLNDRTCISTLGKQNFRWSPMMLLSCCPDCCGCGGTSNVLNGWKYMRDVGIVSGSFNLNSIMDVDDGCQPYLIKPLSLYNLSESSSQSMQTPTCMRFKCTNPLHKLDTMNFHKIDSFELISRYRPDLIMNELMENGPLQVSFKLYEDFLHYNPKEKDNICSTIYVHTSGKYMGRHAAKLLGWGSAKDKRKYWILSNSFGVHWGCNGTFLVPRNGKDYVHFGYAIVAPRVYNHGSKCAVSPSLYAVLACATVLCLNAVRTRSVGVPTST